MSKPDNRPCNVTVACLLPPDLCNLWDGQTQMQTLIEFFELDDFQLRCLDVNFASGYLCFLLMNKFFFANKIHRFANFRRFFAKWGLFFAKWGLLFASLYVRKSPAVLLNLGHPIAPLRFVCAI